MSDFRSTFPAHHAILPVIHVSSERQTLENATIAREAGCDGVFLINHGMSSGNMLELHHVVYTAFPDWWVGVNCLDLHPRDVFVKINSEVAGVWVDNAMIDERWDDQHDAELIRAAREDSGWQGLYFGGVAFKYQRPVEDLVRAAGTAARYMDVVTTSGPGTGLAALREKIAEMKQAIGDFPLAIASGITPDNVHDYLDFADCFLVATGISKNFTQFDPVLVNALVREVRSYQGKQQDDRIPQSRSINSVCFICEWNEGRSAHLELSIRHKLRTAGCQIQLSSAGLSQGGRINTLRRTFLSDLGIPTEEIEAHRSTVFGEAHAESDLVLVSELQMKERILDKYPELTGKVMTIKGFARGLWPENENLSEAEVLLEDAGGHNDQRKLVLYAELEEIAERVAKRLWNMDV